MYLQPQQWIMSANKSRKFQSTKKPSSFKRLMHGFIGERKKAVLIRVTKAFVGVSGSTTPLIHNVGTTWWCATSLNTLPPPEQIFRNPWNRRFGGPQRRFEHFCMGLAVHLETYFFFLFDVQIHEHLDSRSVTFSIQWQSALVARLLEFRNYSKRSFLTRARCLPSDRKSKWTHVT